MEGQWHLHEVSGVEERLWYCAAGRGHTVLLGKTQGREEARGKTVVEGLHSMFKTW